MTTTESEAAPLRLEFISTVAGYRLEVNGGQYAPYCPPIDLARSAVEARSSLYNDLLKFRDEVPPLGPDGTPSVAARALQVLHDQGVVLAYELFYGLKEYNRLVDYCTEILPRGMRMPDDPPLVEVIAPSGTFFPVELLPLFLDAWPKSLISPTDVENAASAFLGFAAITRRVTRHSLVQDPIIDNRPKLPIAFFPYADMEGALAEAAYFESLADQMVVERPLPHGMLDQRKTAELLSRRIFYPVSPGDRTAVDQIHHFACHCNSATPPARGWSLRLGAGNTVEMSDLIVQLNNQRRENSHDHLALPLVFMNACGSSSVDPSSAASFIDLFMDNDNRGFIGTETRIPDDFAAEYSQAFYRHLLMGDTVGMAMHRARWIMLQRYNSPLGILYTFYGNPDLHVRDPVAKESFID